MLVVVKLRRAVSLFAVTLACAAAAPSIVRIDKTESGYRLMRNGKPYVIHGAGGRDKLDVLAADNGLVASK